LNTESLLELEDQTDSPYDISLCKAGTKGCIHAVINPAGIAKGIEKLLDKLQLGEHIKARVKKKLILHQKFRVALAGCPNCCPQPQIKDFGIHGQAVPVYTETPCVECMECVDVCKEVEAIRVNDAIPIFDYDLCVFCGDCEKICPTGSIENKQIGLRIMAGGRLGRHPQLAVILKELADEDSVYEILQDLIKQYKKGVFPFKPSR